MNRQDKVVSVTGGTKGIGAQTAFALAKRGAHIVINGHHEHADATTRAPYRCLGSVTKQRISARHSVGSPFAKVSASSSAAMVVGQFYIRAPEINIDLGTAWCGRGTIFGSVIALFLIAILKTGTGVANVNAENQLAAANNNSPIIAMPAANELRRLCGRDRSTVSSASN